MREKLSRWENVVWCEHVRGRVNKVGSQFRKAELYANIPRHRSAIDQSRFTIASSPYRIGWWYLTLPRMLASTHKSAKLARRGEIQVIINQGSNHPNWNSSIETMVNHTIRIVAIHLPGPHSQTEQRQINNTPSTPPPISTPQNTACCSMMMKLNN